MNLIPLILVLAVAGVVFLFAKPVFLRFMSGADFLRRRNVWFALTIVAFVSPSIWLFVLVAGPLLYWAGRRDSSPIAFYLFIMHVIPPFTVQLPTFLVNQLFEFNMYRLLSIVVLIPAVSRLAKVGDREPSGASIKLVDGLFLAYCGFVLISAIPYESFTNTARRAFLLFIDLWILYFVTSRSCRNRNAIIEVMGSFVLGCTILAPLAVFESLRNSNPYSVIGYAWEVDYLQFAKLLRGDMLRAQVSTGHSLLLGYLFAMALGAWCYLRLRARVHLIGKLIPIALAFGLVVTLSRGPWLVAIVSYFAFMAISPSGSSRLVKAAAISVLVVGMAIASPMGDYLVDLLPFVGTVDSENVLYRQRLAQVSWELIGANPLFGDPFFMRNLEELRQGQGIIDLVNVYAAVAMQSGMVGLFLFLGAFFVGIFKAYRMARSSTINDPDLSELGASLIACMVGTLVIMATSSFYLSLPIMFYTLAGLAAAYSQLGYAANAAQLNLSSQIRAG